MALTDEELYYVRQALKKDEREIKGKVKVMYNGGSFNYGDNVRATASGSENDGDISHPEQVVDNTDIRYNFAGLENNYFIADGSMVLPVKEENNKSNSNIGYVGEIGQDTFIIDVDEGAYPEIWGYAITIYFSENGEYATELDVTFTMYDSMSEETKETTVNITNNDKNILYVVAPDLPTFLNSLRKVVINIKKWSNEEHRVRIVKVDYGHTTIFADDLISSFSVIKQIDLSNYGSPTDEFTLTIDNYEGSYNFPYILSQGSTLGIPYIGINTDLGFKFLSLGTFMYTEVANESNSMAKLTFKGCFEGMANEGVSIYDEDNQTPEEIINNASGGNYNIGTLNLNYNGNIPKPQNVNFANLREQLQGICQYAGSFMKQEPVYPESDTLYYSPTISFYQLDYSRYEDELTLRNMQSYPIIRFGQGIANIDFSYESLGERRTDKKSVIFEGSLIGEEVIFNDETQYGYFVNTQAQEPYDNTSVEIYGNGSLIGGRDDLQQSGVFNIAFMIFNSSPTLNIQVKAYTYSTNRNTGRINNMSGSGNENMTIDNGYITTGYDRQRVADKIFSTYVDEFDISTFGDPTLECGDFILFEVRGGQKKGFIEQVEIDYNGGLQGSLKGVCSDV